MLTNFLNGLSVYGEPGIPLLPSPQASYFGRVFFVNTVSGSDGNTGEGPNNAFKTMGRAFWTDYNLPGGTAIGTGAKAFPALKANDTIYFVGTIREQLVAPVLGQNGLALTGVQIIGMAQGGVRDDNGAKWTYPASGAVAGGALLSLRQQGWSVSNFLMTPEPNGSGGAAILLNRQENATFPDSSHFAASNMRFVGVDVTSTFGIQDVGGCSNVQVTNCEFYLLTNGVYNSSTAIAIPLRWQIKGNRFIDNTNHINMSATDAVVTGNVFVTEATINITLIGVGGQGATNVVAFNTFKNLAADITISDGWTGSATDQWTGNYATDAVVFGVPGA